MLARVLLILAAFFLACCRAQNVPPPQVATSVAAAGPSIERVRPAAPYQPIPFVIAIGEFFGDLNDTRTRGTAWLPPELAMASRDFERDLLVRHVQGQQGRLIESVEFGPSPNRTLHDDLRALAHDRVIRAVAFRYADNSVGVVLDEETNATLSRLKNLLTTRPGTVEVVWAYFEQ